VDEPWVAADLVKGFKYIVRKTIQEETITDSSGIVVTTDATIDAVFEKLGANRT
jgi:hypothetical protein